MAKPVNPYWVQSAFRGRNDDGSQSAATWIANANTNWTQMVDDIFRIRFTIQETAGANNVNAPNFKLQYSLNSGTWTDVGLLLATTTIAGSTYLTHDEQTTQQISSGSFVAGRVLDSLTTHTTLGAMSSASTEMEWSLIINSGYVSQNDNIKYRVVLSNGTLLESYTNTPSITIFENAAPTVALTTPADTGSITDPTPALEFVGTDTNLDTLEYQVQIATENTFASPIIDDVSTTDTGFENLDTPADSHPFTQGEDIRYTVQAGDALTKDTYYWRVRAWDGYVWGNWSATRSFSLNQLPTVSLTSPNDTATISDPTPALEFVGTDADTDTLEYQVQIDTVSDFSHSGIYDETYSVVASTYNQAWNNIGQAFTGNGGVLSKITQRMYKGSSVAGTVYMRIYATSGTYGTSAIPTGSAIATSETLTIEDYIGSGSYDFEFEFTGANRIVLEDGEYYCYVITFSFTSGSDCYATFKSPSVHAGNLFYSWTTASFNDMMFKIETDLFVDAISTTDSGFENLDTPADTHPFTQAEDIRYTVQAADELADDTYYWRVRAYDGTVWSDWSTTRSFTVESITGDQLTSKDIVSGIPSVEKSVISSKHILSSQDIASGIPSIEKSLLAQKHALISQDVATTPVVEKSTITVSQQEHLTALDVTTTPLVEKTGMSQQHSLSLSDILGATPVVDHASLSQQHSLTASDVSVSILVDAATVSQQHVLVAADIQTSISSVEQTTLQQEHNLPGQDVSTGVLDVEKSFIASNASLISSDVSTASPVVSKSEAHETAELVAVDILSGTTTVEKSLLTQVHLLGSNDVFTATPSVLPADITQTHRLTLPVSDPTLLLHDTFTDVDGTAIVNHVSDVAPVGSSWVNIVGAGAVFSNTYQATTDSASAINTGESDVIITAKITVPTYAATMVLRAAGLIFRYDPSDPGNYFRLNASEYSDGFFLYQYVNGTATFIKSVPMPIVGGQVINVEVVLNGSSITATFDDTYVLSHTSSANISKTYHGVAVFRRSYPCNIDDFRVTTLVGAPSVRSSPPVVDLPVLHQHHNITAQDSFSGYPEVQQPVLGVLVALTATSISIGTSLVEQASISQTHNLLADDVDLGISHVEKPSMSAEIALVSSDVFVSSPVVDQPIISQHHVLQSLAISSGQPTLSGSVINQNQHLQALDILSSDPQVDKSNLQQQHALSLSDISGGLPVVERSSISQVHLLQSSDIVSANPVVEKPNILEENMLQPDDVSTGAIQVERSSIGQEHALVSVDAITTPLVFSASISQAHSLSLDDVTSGLPSIELADITVSGVFAVSDLSTGVPFIEQSSLFQNHILVSEDLLSGVPLVSKAEVLEDNVLFAKDVLINNLNVDKPGIGQNHLLVLDNVSTGPARVSQAEISQVGNLQASDVETGPVAVSKATVAEANALSVQGIYSGIPTAGSPIITQVHLLGSLPVSIHPILVDKPGITQVQELSVPDIVSGILSVGAPDIAETSSLSVSDITLTPTVSSPDLYQLHKLMIGDVTLSQPVVDDVMIQQEHKLAVGSIATAPPVVSYPMASLRIDLSIGGIATPPIQVSNLSIAQIHLLSIMSFISGIPIVDDVTLYVGYIQDGTQKQLLIDLLLSKEFEIKGVVTQQVDIQALLSKQVRITCLLRTDTESSLVLSDDIIFGLLRR